MLAEISSNPAGICAIDNSNDSSVSGGTDGVRNITVTVVANGNKMDSSSNTNRYFVDFMVQLLEMFKKDRFILEKRGAFIIR